LGRARRRPQLQNQSVATEVRSHERDLPVRPLNQPWFVKFEIVDVRPDRVSDLTLPDALSGTGLSSNEKTLWSASLR
jgi:hypothetical protein